MRNGDCFLLLQFPWLLVIAQAFLLEPLHRRTILSVPTKSRGLESVDGAQDISADVSSSQLSHAMLRVADVNATISYWTERGATLYTYRQTPTAETAFFGFVQTERDMDRFSLEITKIRGAFDLGNVLQYIGVSKLLDYDYTSRIDVARVVEENKPPPPLFATSSVSESHTQAAEDPNGIEVRSVASAR